MRVPSSLQEKLQMTVPAKEEAGEAWASFESQRDARPAEVGGDYCPENAGSVDGRRFNQMPPGMDIDQCPAEINNMPKSLAGATDVSHDANETAMLEGFTKKSMKGTDDQYTGEHMDLFYGDAGGFVERNNYLDRM